MRKKQKKPKYINKVPRKSKSLEGILSCAANGKFGFVKTESGEEIYIERDNMLFAHNGDRVKVVYYMRGRKNEHSEGRITEVLERNIKHLSCVIIKDLGGFFLAKADDRRFFPKIHIP